MKKLISAALLSVAALGMTSSQASAWPLQKLFCKNCCTVCVRPYNAFTPVCYGSICGDGCCPIQYNQGASCPTSWAGGCAADGAHMIDSHMMAPAHAAPAAQPMQPMPAQGRPPMGWMPMQMPYGMNGNAGYQPGYYPNMQGYGMNPYAYNPNQGR